MKNYYTEKEVKEKAREIYDKMCYNLMVDKYLCRYRINPNESVQIVELETKKK